MAYTPKNWQTGEIIEADELNHIEQGIAAADAAATGTGTIGTQQLANGSVTTPKIAPAAVTNDKLDQEAVDSHNIRTGAIITPLIYDGAVTLPKLGADVIAELDHKADIDGSYESMTVGNAEQLVSSVGIEDQTPYNFRTSGGSTEIGDREELNAVVGVSVPWNQLAKNDLSDWTNEAVTSSYNSGETTITSSADASMPKWKKFTKFTVNHVYIASAYAKSDGTAELNFGFFSSTGSGIATAGYKTNTTYENYTIIGKPTSNTDFVALRLRNATPSGNYAVFKNVNLIDLTLALGSTIADYIYALEQSNTGAGVAWFRKYFPKLYYGYSAPTMQSVKTSAHKMVGFNQCNDSIHSGHYWAAGTLETNKGANYAAIDSKIRVIPNTQYCVYAPDATNGATLPAYLNQWDANGNYIGAQSASIGADNFHVFTTAKNVAEIAVSFYRSGGATTGERICVNLSWDGERDGEYEPYEAHEYALDDITLRGILKLDANNNLYADGDRYLPDGTVERRYGIVDLGTLTWVHSNTWFQASGAVYDAKATEIGSHYTRITIDSQETSFSSATGSSASRYGISAGGSIRISESGYSGLTDAEFKAAMNGVYLIYELATPTTETASPYQQTQIVDDFGTEEFVDAAVEANERDVAIPVGNETVYKANLRAKLEMAPDSPDGDGDYIVRQRNGQNVYIPLVDVKELPDFPSNDGSYKLRCTVTDGTATLSWVSDS